MKRKIENFILSHPLFIFGVLVLVPLLVVVVHGLNNEGKKEKLHKELYELCNEDVHDPSIVEKFEIYDDTVVVLCTTGEKKWVREIRKKR